MRWARLILIGGLLLVPSAAAQRATVVPAQRALGLVRDVSGASAMTPLSGAADVYRSTRAGASAANVGYGGGPVLTSNRTHIIFWQPRGSHLTFDSGYKTLIGRFLADVAAASHSTSNVFALTGQYTDYANRPAAYASRYAGPVADADRLPANGCTEPPGTGPGWTVCLTDSQLQSEIERVVRQDHLPTTNRDVYFLITPRGLGSCMGASPDTGCALGGRVDGYCGYHSYTNDNKVDYAFIPYNAVPGHCQSNHPRPNGSSADPALSTIGHELAEMVTDPDGDAWTDGSGNEIADLCITTFGPAIGGSGSRRYNQSIDGGHFYLQDLWSNAGGNCQPRAKPDHVSFSTKSGPSHEVTFKGSASDPDGRITAYHWFFAGGSSAQGRTVTHRFPKAGDYSVKVRVTDSWGNWGFYTRTVPVA